MNDELVIPGSRERFVWMLVMGVCFLVMGYWGLVEQRMWFLGGAAIVFGVFGLVVTLLMMRPGSTYLRLDPQGFEVVVIKRRYRYAWSDVDGFFLCKLSGAEGVGIAFSRSCSSERIGRELASALTGVEGGIANLFTVAPTRVCDILNEWRRRHGPPP